MNKRKILSLAMALSIVAIMAVGATLAYFTDTDSDTNTMVFGEVSIEQNEYEWNADKTGIQKYTDMKPLMPLVGTFGWADYSEEVNGYDGVAYRRFAMDNVGDKYITVKNTADAYTGGKSDGSKDAYVRTIVAIPSANLVNEEGEFLIGVSVNGNNGTYKESQWTYVTGIYKIDDVEHNVWVFTYNKALAPQQETEPSFCQIYLQSFADQEDALVKSGKIEIKALSQATQYLGFEAEGANVALNTSFGEVNDANLTKWFTAE